jgi:DNA-directed RNA polymerase alpha subunit
MTFHPIDNELSNLKIGQPACRALASIQVTCLSDLLNLTEKQLLSLHGFGPRALRILKEALQKEGLSLMKND